MTWQDSARHLFNLLENLKFSSAHEAIDCDEGFRIWAQWTAQIRDSGQTIYLIGNGASASMASHFAADLAKNGHLHTQVFSDVSLLTAVSNDISFTDVYSEPLRRRGKRGDMLVAISSSGRSPNILKCAQLAREMGITVVSVTGFTEDNPLRMMGDLNAYIAADTYSATETAHAAVLHYWMDLVEMPNREQPKGI